MRGREIEIELSNVESQENKLSLSILSPSYEENDTSVAFFH